MDPDARGIGDGIMRVCFLWVPHEKPETETETDILVTGSDAYDVEICDPH
jgi:hypothetical protein